MKELLQKVWKRIEPILIDLVVICTILLSLSAITILLHKLPLSKEQILIIESIDFYAAVILIMLFVSSTVIRLTKQEWKEITNEEERQTKLSVLEVKKNDKPTTFSDKHSISTQSHERTSKRSKR